VVGVEQWAEIRRLHFVRGLSMREINRRTGLHRDTSSRAIHSDEPPVYRRAPSGSKLAPFKEEIHRLLRGDPKLPGVRVRELLEPLGCTASKTIVDDYLREVRPLFAPPARTFQRTVYRPGEVCQFDLWQPRAPIPGRAWPDAAGVGRRRVLGLLASRRRRAVFSRQTPDLLTGIARCLWQLGGVAQLLVWDRQGGIHGHAGRPTDEFAGFCGQLRVDWQFCEPADPQAKGAVERLQGYTETNFEPGRTFANELDFQEQLDDWFVKVNGRTHKTLRARPVDRLATELELMAPLPPSAPDVDRRWVTRVAPDPFLRFDTCDYSLDPGLVGQRVEVRVTPREGLAVALDSGELACRHQRSFAKHRTITDLAHARALKAGRTEREPAVEIRPLAVYDALTA
jgi:transposase